MFIKGITLIDIPYWWDRGVESLAMTIYNARPDLFDQRPIGRPIMKFPPKEKTTKKTGKKNNNNLLFILKSCCHSICKEFVHDSFELEF